MVSDEVVAYEEVEGLSRVVYLPPEGGDLYAFVRVDVTGESWGLFSTVINISSDSELTFEPFHFDVPFLDEPGRMGTFAGLPSAIPTERRIGGQGILSDGGMFHQVFTSPWPSDDGASGAPESLYQVWISNDGVVGGMMGQTFGVGMLGQGQDDGPSTIGYFLLSVPPLSEGETAVSYIVNAESVGTIVYLEDAYFEIPAAGPLDIEGIGDASSQPLQVMVSESVSSDLVLESPFDFDGDGDVDLTDFAFFQLCYTGSESPFMDSDCVRGDNDLDGDVDLGDFSDLLLTFTGPQ
jgi:hypothetical protein